jgi:hypothetical protein
MWPSWKVAIPEDAVNGTEEISLDDVAGGCVEAEVLEKDSWLAS